MAVSTAGVAGLASLATTTAATISSTVSALVAAEAATLLISTCIWAVAGDMSDLATLGQYQL